MTPGFLHSRLQPGHQQTQSSYASAGSLEIGSKAWGIQQLPSWNQQGHQQDHQQDPTLAIPSAYHWSSNPAGRVGWLVSSSWIRVALLPHNSQLFAGEAWWYQDWYLIQV